MSVKRNKKYTDIEIEKLFEESKSLNLYPGALGLHSIIATSLDFHNDISNLDAEVLVAQTLKTVRRKKTNLKIFLEEINKQELEFLRTPKKEFHIVTNISIHPKIKLRPIVFDNINIRFYEKIPPKYDRNEHIEYAKKILRTPELPTLYKTVVLILKDRSASAAAVKSLARTQ